MYTINPGEFKHPIRVQRLVSVVDEDNIPIEADWEDIIPNKTFKAKIKNMSGRETIVAQGSTSIKNKRFYIRYSKFLNLTNEDRIVYNEQNYNITYVSDIEEAHKYYEIVVELID
ncbi:head-tail adaptor protein [Clostridium botulinum]|uniref:phage head closure protein n=1 Tax=Clostridium botulinum TaxID=1491 RepID=UPI0007749141|nr:phage head closure protein [Clostridium botulinum]NFL86230.1 head-tail adaptor protein [Clostridium botulinum]NFO19695.1 head-tail adaptor protein [Clostridium botulinum]